ETSEPGEAVAGPRGFAAFTGLLSLSSGAGPMMKFEGMEMPPPRFTFTTVTPALPTPCTSEAGMVTRIVLAVAEVIGRSSPFQRIFEAELKFVPVTVSVKDPSPAFFKLGFSEVKTGANDDTAGSA